MPTTYKAGQDELAEGNNKLVTIENSAFDLINAITAFDLMNKISNDLIAFKVKPIGSAKIKIGLPEEAFNRFMSQVKAANENANENRIAYGCHIFSVDKTD
jgi:hypothetical protein